MAEENISTATEDTQIIQGLEIQNLGKAQSFVKRVLQKGFSSLVS